MNMAIDNITFAYADTPICQHLSWTLPTTGVVCLWSPSGGGKTTLLRLLAGLEQPQSGKIQLPDTTRVAMMFQENRLLPWRTAVQNAAIACEDNAAVLSLLRQVGLEDYCDSYPTAMSGGQQRRVALVRALAADSTLLLLDEPFTGLDDNTKALVLPLICEAARTKPVVLVTHDIAEAQALDATILPLGELPLSGQLDARK